MHKILLSCLFVMMFVALPVLAQDLATPQGAESGQNAAAVQPSPLPTALTAYTKWRNDSLPNYAQALLTPHYTVAIVAQRLDGDTAQVEVLIAADMKHYMITIRPVTLTRQANGETENY